MDNKIKQELEAKNSRIINAVIEKAGKICPGSLALIGVYGSFMTGEIHNKSDLDLMIVINDDNGWALSSTFICDEIGYDIYCTTWDSLDQDATYQNPNISKLMDSKLVYIADSSYENKLNDLRQKVRDIMSAPFSSDDYEKCNNVFNQAVTALGMLQLSNTIGTCRKNAAEAVYECCNAICLANKTYFRYGCKKFYYELKHMEKRPDNIVNLIEAVVRSRTIQEVKSACHDIVTAVDGFMKELRQSVDNRPVPSDDIRGSYEEMYSNWRNKMYYAAEIGNAYLSFDSMAEMQFILDDINSECQIGEFDVLGEYDPDNLMTNARQFDSLHHKFGEVYKKVGLEPIVYTNIEEFVVNYLK